MKYIVNILFFLIILCASSAAQETAVQFEKATIESKAFDRTVSTMIKHSVPLIGVKELHESQEKYIILDAREPGEYRVSHLEGAIFIGFDHWDSTVMENIDKNQPIVVYCSIGVRSEMIGEKLQALGFTNVKNLYGSIFEWANQGYSLVDNAGYPTKKVHGYSWIWGKWMTNDNYEKVYK